MDRGAKEIDKKISINPKAPTQFITASNKFNKIICPSRLCVSGPSLSGKSKFLLGLVVHRELIYDSKFDRIIYCSPHCMTHEQDKYIHKLKEAFPELELCAEMPDIKALNIEADGLHKLLLFDDMISDFNSSQSAFNLLTIESHHKLISVAVTSHNFFASSKFQKTLSRNYSELVLLFSKSDKLTLRYLGQQLFPESSKLLVNSMKWVESNFDDHERYLLIDLSPISHLPGNMMVRTRIFPLQDGTLAPVFFVPQK